MKKKYIKRLSALVLISIITVGYVLVMQILAANHGDPDYRTLKFFYHEAPQSLDVVFMGSSEITYGYSAPEAYREAGFTSYPFAFTINPVLLWKYELEEIEKLQQPKVLLIETNGALYEEDKYLETPNCVNMLTESMPMSVTRIRAAFENSDHPLERLVPFIKYHYKWPEAVGEPGKTNMMMWRQGHAKLRGAYSMLYRVKLDTTDLCPYDDVCAPLNAKAEAALTDFLEQCKASEIEHIVFVEYPHILNDDETYERHQRAKTAEKMIREAGFDYIDLSSDIKSEGLDIKKDFFDADHLVAPGQRKISRYLARLVKDKYLDETIEQSEANRQSWDESADLIERFYILYDQYISKHSDDPYEKVYTILLENRQIMDELAEINPE